MTTASDSAFEFLRHRAGLDLTPNQQTELQRLIKVLRYGSRFQAIFVEITDPALGERLIARIDEALATASMLSARIDLSSGQLSDVATLENALHQVRAEGKTIVHLVNADGWLKDDRLASLNLRREALAHGLDCRLVFWLPTALLERIAQRAPDLWSWRSGVYNLSNDIAPANLLPAPEHYPPRLDRQGGTLAERAKRIAVLREWLQQTNDDELRLPLLDELAALLADMGNSDEALAIRRDEELPIYLKLGDAHAEAVTYGRVADILDLRGELDEALHIRRQKVLPIYDRLGDVRSKAITQSKIADILQERGELDEALRIRKEEELPVYQRLGDLRAQAIAQGKIAGILRIRGKLDEALRIRQEEELPIYEHLGDLRAQAFAQGKIADILQVRGELDEALHIRKEEELPVYERLGDVRAKAVTQSKIASILQARGELDEALALQQQQLPIVLGLQDQAGIAHILYSIACIRMERGDHTHGNMLEIIDDLNHAYAISCKLEYQEAIGSIGTLLALALTMSGDKVNALSVLDKAESALRKLGWHHEITRVRILRAEIAGESEEKP